MFLIYELQECDNIDATSEESLTGFHVHLHTVRQLGKMHERYFAVIYCKNLFSYLHSRIGCGSRSFTFPNLNQFRPLDSLNLNYLSAISVVRNEEKCKNILLV